MARTGLWLALREPERIARGDHDADLVELHRMATAHASMAAIIVEQRMVKLGLEVPRAAEPVPMPDVPPWSNPWGKRWGGR